MPFFNKNNLATILITSGLFVLLIVTWLVFQGKSTGSENCMPTNKVVSVAPNGGSGCTNLQSAIDNLGTDGRYTINLLPGIHNISTSGSEFAMIIKDKQVDIKGDAEKGSKATIMLFGSKGGILADNSSINIEWLELKNDSSSPLIAIQNSKSTNIAQVNLSSGRGNALQIDNSTDVNIKNSLILGGMVGIASENTQNLWIENNKIAGEKYVISAGKSSITVKSNLFVENSKTVIDLSSPLITLIENNTFAKNKLAINMSGSSQGQQITMNKNVFSQNDSALQIPSGFNLFITNNHFWQNKSDGIEASLENTFSQDPKLGNNYCVPKEKSVGYQGLFSPPCN